MSATEFYLKSLHLDALPEGISDFKGEGSDSFPAFSSAGYFRYKATPTYFEQMTKYKSFSQQSEFNRQIHQAKCNGPEMPNSYSYWTKETIDFKDKLCYTGTFVPYVHYLVYDAKSTEVYHFITGMRE